MIPKNTQRVIMYLLKNTEKLGFNINQIANLTQISKGSAHKILKGLEKDEIIIKQQISNASHYQLNLANPETQKLSELLILTEKRELQSYAKIYAKEIEKFNDAEMIILFGSVLKKKNFNDVDVLFLTNKTKKVTEFCLELSKIRTKPIVPLIMIKKDLIKAIQERKDAIISLMKEGIILKGESVFVEVINNARI